MKYQRIIVKQEHTTNKEGTMHVECTTWDEEAYEDLEPWHTHMAAKCKELGVPEPTEKRRVLIGGTWDNGSGYDIAVTEGLIFIHSWYWPSITTITVT